MKKPIIVLLIGLVVVFTSAQVFAESGHEEHQHGVVAEEEVKTAAEVGPIEIGNKICPVSGEEIKEGEVYKFEHEGKIYNFCCSMCVKDFKKDPQKYIDILEEDEKKGSYHDHGEH